MTLNPLEVREAIDFLDVGVPANAVIHALAALEALERFVRGLRAELDPRVIEWITTHGPLENGAIRYFVAANKSVRCVDKLAAAEALLTVSRGELGMFTDLLCSQPYKAGSARAILPAADYARCFRTFEDQELREGKPPLRLQKVDTRFLPERG